MAQNLDFTIADRTVITGACRLAHYLTMLLR